jgi:hypothetical protein
MRKRFIMVTGAALATAAAVAITTTSAGALGAGQATVKPVAAAKALPAVAGAQHLHQSEFKVKIPAAVAHKAGLDKGRAAPHAAAAADFVITCILRVDYPHNSSHVDGTVNTVAQVSCDSAMTSLTLLLQLYYNGSVANSVIQENFGAASLTQNVAAPCIPGGWQAHAETLVEFPAGVVPPALYDSEDSQPISIGC